MKNPTTFTILVIILWTIFAIAAYQVFDGGFKGLIIFLALFAGAYNEYRIAKLENKINEKI